MLTKQGVMDLIKQGYDPRVLGAHGGKRAAAKKQAKIKSVWKRNAAQEEARIAEMWWNK